MKNHKNIFLVVVLLFITGNVFANVTCPPSSYIRGEIKKIRDANAFDPAIEVKDGWSVVQSLPFQYLADGVNHESRVFVYLRGEKTHADASELLRKVRPVLNGVTPVGSDPFECVYYGRMSAVATPDVASPTDVVSFRLKEETLPPVEYSQLAIVSTAQTLPSTTYLDDVYHFSYQLQNKGVAGSYQINSVNLPQGVHNDGSTCQLDGQPHDIASAASCLVNLSFTPKIAVPSDALGMMFSAQISFTNEVQTKVHVDLQSHVYFAHNIIVLGDSLSDMGNNGVFTNHDPVHSEAKVWNALFLENPFAAAVGRDIIPSLKLTAEDNTNNVNVSYAYGGAVTESGWMEQNNYLLCNDFIKLCFTDTPEQGKLNMPLSPDQQLGAMQQHLQAQSINADSKVFLWISGNDLLYKYAFLPILRNGFFPYNPIDNIQATLTRLTTEFNVPTKNIYVLNLPDLSRVPLMTRSLEWNGMKLSYKPAEVQAATLALNNDLANMLQQFPGVHTVRVDEQFARILASPSEYGFDPAKLEQVCPNRNSDCAGYLFSDDVHPVMKAHQLIADEVKQTILTLR